MERVDRAPGGAGLDDSQLLRILDITAGIASGLNFGEVAQRIVDAVTEVTDFRVATLTVREGDRCRRVATGGPRDDRIGMTTAWAQWEVLLQPEWLQGSRSYLVPPEAPAQWADVPDIAPSDDPDAWTAEHGLVLPLSDHDDAIIGFVAVDEPRSGKLPGPDTIDALELFATQAQMALANARLYAVARRQATTMSHLFDVAKAMATTEDLGQVIPRILEAMHERFAAVEVGLARLADGRVRLHRSTAAEEPLSDVVLAADGPVAALARQIEAEGTVVVRDLGEHPALGRWLSARARSLLLAGRRDGSGITVALSVAATTPDGFADDDRDFLTGLLDITVVALRNAELYEEVRFAADRDALTGLRNRRALWTLLDRALADAAPGTPVSLAVVDVDDFKAINDRWGHAVGDRALIHVAARLEAGSRETDTVFRIGGEEFVVVMPDTSPIAAAAVMSRAAEAVKRTRLDLPSLSISAGIACAPGTATSPEDLFRVADEALYEAKRSGKDRVVLAG